jgi:hypothetical protein
MLTFYPSYPGALLFITSATGLYILTPSNLLLSIPQPVLTLTVNWQSGSAAALQARDIPCRVLVVGFTLPAVGGSSSKTFSFSALKWETLETFLHRAEDLLELS